MRKRCAHTPDARSAACFRRRSAEDQSLDYTVNDIACLFSFHTPAPRDCRCDAPAVCSVQASACSRRAGSASACCTGRPGSVLEEVGCPRWPSSSASRRAGRHRSVRGVQSAHALTARACRRWAAASPAVEKLARSASPAVPPGAAARRPQKPAQPWQGRSGASPFTPAERRIVIR